MTTCQIDPKAIEAIKNFSLPQELPFGKYIAPVMVVVKYNRGEWTTPELVPYAPLSIDPTCKVLHYAQEIFEGMKAYRVEGKGPFLFRPEENMKRFNLSAKRMAMPEVPESIFMDSIMTMTRECAPIIPRRSGESLYLRPFMFASENGLGIKPAEEFIFMVVASPSGAYFSGGSVQVQIERQAIRACPDGVGFAKTGGNYAASLFSMIEAKKRGYDQVLWLDALHKKNIEELSGMNFFAVYNNKLVTPKLTTTILDGITRRSLIELARHHGFKVEEKEMSIDQVLNDIQSGDITEAFACGTAVIITPISHLGEANGNRYPLKQAVGEVSMKLRQSLLDLQEGRANDPFNWVKKVL
ncbi:MAG: branched-chain amino acid aminotransferase [Bdellovibrio sp.]